MKQFLEDNNKGLLKNRTLTDWVYDQVSFLYYKETVQAPGATPTSKPVITENVVAKLTPYQQVVGKDTSIADVEAKINQLQGMDEIKEKIYTLKALAEYNVKNPDSVFKPSLHSVFTGNPGTGKTTIARIVGEYLRAVGYLSRGNFVEASSTDMMGMYLGQTGPKTRALFEKALGGVLFIDEAYSLATKYHHRTSSYGQEAIAELIKLMEDYRKDIVVIVAGYEEPMNEFLETNPGIASRFNNKWMFEDYSIETLRTIVEQYLTLTNLKYTEEALDCISHNLELDIKKKDFANARAARNYAEAATIKAIGRGSGTIAAEDVEKKDDEQPKIGFYL